MKSLRFLFALVSISFLAYSPINASHLIGGSITWECIKSGTDQGKFVFTVKKYRTCKVGSATSVGVPTIQNPLGANISASFVSQRQISLPCYDPAQSQDCFGGTVTKQNDVIEEFVFRSSPVTLVGTPAANGSVFYVTDCCRPSGITNTTSTGSFVWRAVMYPYKVNGVALTLGSSSSADCYDNSPFFIDDPLPAICSSNPVNSSASAFDLDGDSLTYQFAESWQGVNQSISYNFGYSFSNPLPSSGVPLSTLNVPVSLNAQTGVLSFTSFDAGKFVTTIEVKSYRGGQLISKIYREIPINIVTCAPMPPPFPPNTFNSPPSASITHNSITSPTTTTINVTAGDFLEFDLSSIDLDLLPGLVAQSVNIEAIGNNFGASFTDSTSGCNQPPCITIDTSVGTFNLAKQQWKNSSNIVLPVKWQTSCAHLDRVNGIAQPTLRQIQFRLYDDYCPTPGQSFANINVMIWPDTSSGSFYTLDSISLNPTSATLHWPQYTGTGFTNYYIYKYVDSTLTFKLEHIESNVSVTSYTDNSLQTNNRYYIKLDSNICNIGTVYSTLNLDLKQNVAGIADLNWNTVVEKSTVPNLRYDIWKSSNGNTYAFLDSTRGTSFIDSSLRCDDSASYYVVAFYNNQIFTKSLSKQLIVRKPQDFKPQINLLVSDTAGNVLVGWNPFPIDSFSFQSYHVFVSKSASGPFTLVDSIIDFDTLSYFHLNAGADTNTLYYHIKVKVKSLCTSADLFTKRSNIVGTNSLNISNVNLNFIQLNWGPFFNNKSGKGKYFIYRRLLSPTWVKIAEVNWGTLTYTDDLIECGTTIEYKVEIDTMDVKIQVSNSIFVKELEIEISKVNDSTLAGIPGNNPKWYLGDSLISQINDTLIISAAGTYFYTVRLNNGCLVRSKGFEYTPTGISESSRADNLKIFPNPNDGTFNIKLNANFGEQVNISIEDRIGRVIYQTSFSGGQQLNKLQLPENAKGLYFVRVISGDKVLQKKVLVQ